MTQLSTGEPLDSAIPYVADHTRRYVESGGAEGHAWRGVWTLVLTTTGRRSTRLRHNVLIYGRHGDDYVVVASYAGNDHHPLWYLNLLDDPNVTIQVGQNVIPCTARVATPQERPALWSMMSEIWPDYPRYQRRTDREIPVILLSMRTFEAAPNGQPVSGRPLVWRVTGRRPQVPNPS